MELTLIGNVKEFTPAEQKTLYSQGADFYTGVYWIVADATYFVLSGKDVMPNSPALRAFTNTANISWILTEFRGKQVAFGSAIA